MACLNEMLTECYPSVFIVLTYVFFSPNKIEDFGKLIYA